MERLVCFSLLINAAAMRSKFGTNCLNSFGKTEERLTSIHMCKGLKSANRSGRFWRYIRSARLDFVTPVVNTVLEEETFILCQRYFNSREQSYYCPEGSRSCSTDCEKMTTPSSYTSENYHLTVDSMMSTENQNVLVLLLRPKRILENLCGPWCNVNVDLFLSRPSISICQYLKLASNV